MTNFLEQLAAEWYEYRGYYVRRNVKVGRLEHGGFEGELDVVAFHARRRHLVHVEASTDAASWEQREARFRKKFETGKKYIRDLFAGFDLPPNTDQIALLVIASDVTHAKIGGATVLPLKRFMETVRAELAGQSHTTKAIPEQFVILRGLQYAANFWK